MPRRLIALLGILLLSGCALFDAPRSTPLPGGAQWQLLSPDQLGRSISVTQRVTGNFNGQSVALLFYLEVTPDRLALVGTTPDGSELFSLEKTASALNVHATPLLPKQLRPEMVLADLQMAFWPAAAIEKNLRDTDLQLREQNEAVGMRRTITQQSTQQNGEPVITIDYDSADRWRGSVRFEQHVWHYSYVVETLQSSP